MYRKFSRSKKARDALLRSLVRAFVSYGKIITTKAKAKSLQVKIENYLTLAKKNTVSNQRILLARLGNDKKTLQALFTKIAPGLGEKTSGFTKITYLPQRVGDRAPMARIEWSQAIKNTDQKDSKQTKRIKSVKSAKKPA